MHGSQMVACQVPAYLFQGFVQSQKLGLLAKGEVLEEIGMDKLYVEQMKTSYLHLPAIPEKIFDKF
jgi:hypothetical protein